MGLHGSFYAVMRPQLPTNMGLSGPDTDSKVRGHLSNIPKDMLALSGQCYSEASIDQPFTALFADQPFTVLGHPVARVDMQAASCHQQRSLKACMACSTLRTYRCFYSRIAVWFFWYWKQQPFKAQVR